MAMKYFTLEELTHTNTGIANVPNMAQERNLTLLVDNVLDPARYLIGEPVIVNSAFRSPEVNKAVGGVASSAHLTGMAADIECSDNLKLFNLLKNNFNFTQLIFERGDEVPQWVHVSYDPNDLKCEVLKFDGLTYTKYK
jgi:hypothetical protein